MLTPDGTRPSASTDTVFDGAIVHSVPAGTRRSTTYLPELEALRGIAILLVFLHHANGLIDPRVVPPHISVSLPWALIAAGHTGVSLFFVLSAFLLSLPFLAEADGHATVRRADYFRRRALRILPLYLAAVWVTVLLASPTAAGVVAGLRWSSFLGGYGDTHDPLWPYNVVWWSLATEVQFYLLLPLLPVVLRTASGRRIGLALAVAYVLAYALCVTALAPLDVRSRLHISHSVLGRAPQFACGIAAAWLYRRHGARMRERAARLARLGGGDLLCAAALLGLALLLHWVVWAGYLWVELDWHQVWHVVEGALWAVVVLTVLVLPPRLKALVSNRGLLALGVISYSVYLVHYPILFVFRARLSVAHAEWFGGWTAPGAGAVAAVAVVVVLLSAATYYAVERPFLLRKARIDR